MCNLITYVEEVTKTGMNVDEFAPRLAFFFVCQSDFFEEIAKFRAVRRVYAKIMRERFGAKNPESMRLRFHCQTAAASLTKPQYHINVVRTGLQALAAVLGGTQSLHTNGMDEAFAIPTEEAMKIALRTQQIIADESGVPGVVDPLGGSYFVENLTTQYERGIFKVIDEVEQRGGTIKMIEEGWFQRRIADFAYDTALKKASGGKPVIGVNKYVDAEEKFDIELHPHDPTTAERQIARLNRVRRERDSAKMATLLDKLVAVAQNERENIMPVTIEPVAAAVYMAHAYGELTGGLGVALVTAGPGVTNAMTGIANAYVARAPVLVLSGVPPRPQENRGALQDLVHTDMVRPITRYARTVREPSLVLQELDEAVARAF